MKKSSSIIFELLLSKETNNYKLFFPFALPALFTGIGMWFFDTDYNFTRTWHPLLLIHSMLFPVVLGFFWTGIPRFIAIEFPSLTTKIIYIFLLSAALFAFLIESIVSYKLIMFVSYAGIFFWYLKAVMKRKVSPPVVLSFLFFALLSGFIGTGIIFISEIHTIPSIILSYGLNLHRYVFFIMLITSVGSRMIPVMELKKPPGKDSYSIWSSSASKKPLIWWFISGVVFLILSVPVTADLITTAILRFLVLIFIAKEIFLFFRPSNNKNLATNFLYFIQIFLILSPFIVFIKGMTYASSSHFFFISMLFLFVMIVSARVVLSHGGHGLGKEIKSRLFAIAYLLITAGIFMRTFSYYIDDLFPVYRITSAVIILAVCLWLVELFHSILFIRESQQPESVPVTVKNFHKK